MSFYSVICMFLREHCLFVQVSYFEIYMDKIRDLLDGEFKYFLLNYRSKIFVFCAALFCLWTGMSVVCYLLFIIFIYVNTRNFIR